MQCEETAFTLFFPTIHCFIINLILNCFKTSKKKYNYTVDKCFQMMYIITCPKDMREWLSGGAPPCQGGGRGFDPRLALKLFEKNLDFSGFFFSVSVKGCRQL